MPIRELSLYVWDEVCIGELYADGLVVVLARDVDHAHELVGERLGDYALSVVCDIEPRVMTDPCVFSCGG